MKIYLVRHGETEYNVRSLYYGFTDVPLNEHGLAQAEMVGKQLKNICFDKVYISDLMRARQTADTIIKMNVGARKHLPKVITCPDIREMDFGLWEGCTYQQIRESWSGEYDAWAKDWLNTAPPGGEAFKAFFERCKNAFLKIVRENDPENTILIVAHNGSLRSALAVMLDLGAEGTWHFNFEQDAYSLVDFEYDNFTVGKINSRDIREI